MASIFIHHGTEGPSHDPYLYTEITVSRTSPHFTGQVTYHAGLNQWVAWRPDGRPERRNDLSQCKPAVLADLFRVFSGVTVQAAERAFEAQRERKLRAHKCGERHLHWLSGYPGESLLCCEKCGDVLHYEVQPRLAVE